MTEFTLGVRASCHLWGRKQVAIPVSAVASVEDGIRLNITKRQVGDLPPLGRSR